tara:strand:- start:1754 stop:6961 length:5208 start_codon:yes stop_codon:yes gene_type:complete
MEPEEIEALIAAERAKSVSDDAILSRLRFQGIDATEYLKKKDETEGSSSVSGSETGNMASVSSISPFLGQTDTSSVGLVADPPLLANAWDIASPEDRESLHISPEYYDGYQKAGFIELANTVQQYNLPNITEVYQSFLSNNESWFTSVPKGVDALASELIQNEQFIEEHLGGVATTIDSYAYGSQGGIGGVSLPPIQRSTEAIEQDRTKIAKKFLNQALLDATANALRNNMPDNVKGDEKALEYMEQYMLENYRSMIDLSGDGTVGNTPFLQFDGFETWRSGDVVGVAPQFSGYLADKFEAAGIDIINSVYNFFGGSAKNVSERREEAERIREETLQFQNGVGESFSNNDFINGIKQIAGFAAEATPTMAVMIPAATATGGLGLGFWWTTGLISLEGATISTIQEAARTRGHDMFKTYTKNGETISHSEMMLATGGDPELALGYTEGFNESARQGHLSSVFGTDMVATGASSLFFLRALRGVKGGAPGAAASDWWKYHLANAGYSVPVTGVTGGLAAMSNYVSIMERTGQEIVWADVRQIGLDVSISAGVSIGPAGAIIGSGINRMSSTNTTALTRDRVGRNGGNIKIQQERTHLLRVVREKPNTQEAFSAERRLVDIENKVSASNLADEEFYTRMNEHDYSEIVNLHKEFNKKFAERTALDDPTSPVAKALDAEMAEIIQVRRNIESLYEVDNSPITPKEVVDGDVYRPLDDPTIDNPVPLAFDPAMSSWWYTEWVSSHENLIALQGSVMKARKGGEQGQRVPLSQDFDVKLKLMDSKTENRIRISRDKRAAPGGVVDQLTSLQKTLPPEVLESLPEAYPKDALGLLDRYLYSLHAKERNAHVMRLDVDKISKLEAKPSLTNKEVAELTKLRGYVEEGNGSGLSTEKAQAFLESLSPEVKASLDKIVGGVRSIQDETRAALVEYGLIDSETFSTWSNQFTDYVPLHGQSVDDVAGGITASKRNNFPGIPRDLSLEGSYMKRAEGRSDEASNIFSRILFDNTNVHVAGQRNLALNSLHELVSNNPNPDVYSISETGNPLDPGTITTYVNGQKKYINFANPEYAKSLKTMPAPKSETFIRAIEPTLRFMRKLPSMFTSYNPTFWAANAPRDAPTSVLNAVSAAEAAFGYGMRNGNGQPVKPGQLIKEMAMPGSAEWTSTIRTITANEFQMSGAGADTHINALYQEYKAHGGKTGWAFQQPLLDLQASLRSEIKPGSKAQKGGKWLFDNSFGMIESFNNVFESAYRFQVYKAARSQGIEADYAAAMSKNATIDFNRNGSQTASISGLKYFFNAGVQGIDKTVKTAVQTKAKVDAEGNSRNAFQRITTAQKMIGGIALFGGLVTEFNMNVSEIDRDGISFYDKIPDSVKERNMIFMIPGSKTGQKVLVPLAYGFGSAYTMGLSGAEVMDGQRSAEEGALFAAKSVITNFSPVYFSGTEKEASKSTDPVSAFGKLTQDIATPDALKPMVQSWQNVDAFGGEIVPEEKEGVSRSSQYYTSGVALRNATDLINRSTGGSKNVSGDVDINPDLIEHLLNSYGGGIATFLDRTTDAVFDIRTKSLNAYPTSPPVNPDENQGLTPTVQGGTSDDGFAFEKWPVVRRWYGKDFPYATYGNYYDAQEVVSAYISEFSDPQELNRMKDEAMPSRDDLNEEDQKRYNGSLAMKEVFSSVSKPLLKLNETRKLLVTRQRDINAWVGSSKADIAEWNNLESKIKNIKEGEVKIMMEVMKQYYKFFPKPEE